MIVWQVDSDLGGVREWVGGKMGEEVSVGAASGKLTHFIVEKFVPHKPQEEHYVRYSNCKSTIYSIAGNFGEH